MPDQMNDQALRQTMKNLAYEIGGTTSVLKALITRMQQRGEGDASLTRLQEICETRAARISQMINKL